MLNCMAKTNLQIYHLHTWSGLLVPLVNMIKEGCGNKSALLILFIFYLKKSQKSNLSLENNNFKWGKYHYEINVFLLYTLATINGTLLFNTF